MFRKASNFVGFLLGVFFQSLAIFHDVRCSGECVQRHELHRCIAENGQDLFYLMRIVRCQNDREGFVGPRGTHREMSPRTFFWTARTWRMPCPATRRRRLRSLWEKGLCSALPW